MRRKRPTRDGVRPSVVDLTRLLVLAAASSLVVLAACNPEEAPSPEATPMVAGSEIATGTVDGDGLPDNAPPTFAFGREAPEELISAWDIDVRPDGTGLPPGSGTVAEGRDVYMVHCIACHGPTGTEGPEDVLVDSEQWDLYPTRRTVGNYWPHATTLYDYIRKAMPQLTPGILTSDQVYAVIAYVLHLNEIVPEDAVMDAETLPAVVMPARDKFVVDDRMGGAGPVR